MAPKFSILTPVYKPDIAHLRACIESVLAQTTDDWEHLLVADGPQPDDVIETIKSYRDSRIVFYQRPDNGGISAATQDALDRATGEFIALLDNDDLLAPHALGTMAWEFQKDPNVDFAFSDEDHLEYETDKRINPFFKPGFSRERLRQQMYLGHLIVCRRELAQDVGGFRSEFDGSQDHDLALRATEKARRVFHLPQILYHWRESPTSTAMDASAKDWAYEAGVRAVQDHLDRTQFPAVAKRNPDWPGIIDLEPDLIEQPLVSIIIPTGFFTRVINGKDSVLIDLALTSLIDNTSYANYEVVIVIDSNSDLEHAQYLLELAPAGRIKIVQDERKFNFAKSCNLGASHASGDVLIFHNDDTEIIQSDWIQRLVMFSTREDIGAVGVKLIYADGRINHAGIWSKEGHVGHRYRGFPPNHPGYLASMTCAQNSLATTGACLAVERHKFEEVGGFSTQFPLSYNDVDMCLKLTMSGYRSVTDGATTVIHHESSSRDPEVEDWEMDLIHDRWKPLMHHDPYMNPNLSFRESVDEYPPPTLEMIMHREKTGAAKHEARAWPSIDSYLYVGS